jgi:hypothetical protein
MKEDEFFKKQLLLKNIHNKINSNQNNED